MEKEFLMGVQWTPPIGKQSTEMEIMLSKFPKLKRLLRSEILLYIITI